MGDSLVNLLLTSSNDIIDFGANRLHLMFSIQTSSYLLIGFNEVFEFLLEAIILIVQISHVFVEGFYLSLELDLVLVHLIRVMLQTVSFITDTLFVLLQLLKVNGVLVNFELGILALHIFIFVGLKKLLLSICVLLILTL